MSGEIIRSNTPNLPVMGTSDQLPKKQQAQLRQRVADAAVSAIGTAAEVQAASFVANVALTQAAMLHHQAAALGAQDPIAADDFAGIVSDFVYVARTHLRGMGQ